MAKLYVGNLPEDVEEEPLRIFFSEIGEIEVTSITIKRGGYAFVDFKSPELIDQAIEKLHGQPYGGKNLMVEPSVAGGGDRRTLLQTRVRFSGVPVDCSDESLEQLISSAGEIDKCEKYSSRDGQTRVIQVSYLELNSALEAVRRLNNKNFEGSVIRVERLMDRRTPVRRNMSGGMAAPNRMNMGAVGGGSPINQRHTEFPLRILVLSEMVGAIIGRQGATIREITQQTRARVDVHRKDSAGSLEKAITIYGNPENCTNACKRILEVMSEEAANTNKGDIPLKILAHNNLIGRIIGKGGSTIKKIMEDTNTRLTVSSINDINSFNLERIITIKGSIENIAKAENIISAKLRQSYENDLQAFAPHSAMFPGLHPMAMMSTIGFGLPRGALGNMNMFGNSCNSFPPFYPSSLLGNLGPSSTKVETAYLYIPNTSVGAVIGTKGSYIKNLIRNSGASIKIAPLEDETNGSVEVPERRVTIIGNAEAQWKSQGMLFEKVREEGYGINTEELKLTVEITVPTSQVGRIIGKGGQNVRDLQRYTCTVIKLPQQGMTSSEETLVQIFGGFMCVQSAQRRIRHIVLSSMAAACGPVPPRSARDRTPTLSERM